MDDYSGPEGLVEAARVGGCEGFGGFLEGSA